MADSQAVVHTGMGTTVGASVAEPNQTPGDILSAALNVTPGQKRVFAQVGEEKPRKKKNKKPKLHQGPVVPKNALMQLNEIKPGLVYNVVAQEGPVHNPVFRVQVEVNGQMFEGEAISKKKAKLDAAEKALKSFIQVPDASAAAHSNGKNAGDFTTDQGEGSGFSAFEGNKQEKTNGESAPAVKKDLSLAGIPMSRPVQPQGKNPVMILNEIRPGTQYECIAESGDHILKNFTMQVNLDGREFVGEGRNKKQAKARAAQAALKELYNLEFQNPPEEDGIPYFVGKDEEWTQYKIQTLTLKTGQQIQYDGKNPIQKLNELYKGIVYKCTEPEGPFKAANLFRVTVEVEGQEYEGMANSKKSAKLSAASAALESLAITGILSMREEQLGTLRVERNEKQRQMMQRLREAQVAHGGPLWPKKKPLEERGFPGPVNPCTRLNERFKSAQYKIVGQLGEYPNTQFTVQCVVQGVSYLGAGRSKKIAKYNAAEKAMRARNIWTEQDEHLKKQRVMEDGKTYKNPPEPRRQRGARRGGVRGGMFTGGQDGGMGRGGRGGFRGGAMGGAMGGGRGSAAGAMGRGVGTGFRGARGAGVRGGTRGGARGGGATGGFGAQGTFGAGGAGGVGSGGMNPGFKFNQAGPQGGFKFGASNQGGGGKPFKSVLSQQWTNFRKAGELGSGGVTFNPPPPPQKPRPTQSAPVSTGYNNMAQNTAQYQQQSQENTDFTSDNYSYDNSNQQQEPYSYGYGTMDNTQQQNFNYAASAYTAGYQNPNYGYGYGGYGTDMYAQGHSY